MTTGAPDRPESTKSSASVGPYRLLRRLGDGAMGTVWLAEEEGRRVAVKILHPHLAERRGFFRRFGREARAGRRVRHPNVVRTLDSDLLFLGDQASCILVMEYVEGRTLRELLSELGVVPETLVREIGRQVSEGLQAIHAEGLVHRDLKPENVMITTDHQVRIMDLGIAKERMASVAITEAGQFAGSLLYASPEQIRGASIGPAADLYALGVLLFELATGENPFRRDDVAAVLHLHTEEVPPLVLGVRPETSPFLTEVVARLLAKVPQDRFESAGRVAQILDEGEESRWWTGRERSLRVEPPRRPVLPVRRETGLYGRDGDLDFLDACWTRSGEGNGHTVLLEGEAGIGKTRLLDGFLARSDVGDAHVLYGSYAPAGGLGALSDAVIGRFGYTGLEEALGSYLGPSAGLAPALAALLKHEKAPVGQPSLARDAIPALFVQLLRGLADERPLLWVVEDLHHASPRALGIALALARAVQGRRALLLLTTRPGLPAAEIVQLSRLELIRRRSLGRLSAEEVAEILLDAFGNRLLVETLGSRIAHLSDGVPFFLFEMIRSLRDKGCITEQPDGTLVQQKAVDEIEIPSAIHDLVAFRLQGLSREERALLDVGAVQGYTFDAELTACVLDRSYVPVLQDLASLERRLGIVRASGRRHRFDHHQIQEILAGELPRELSERYHVRLAELLQAREEPSPETSARLAHHLSRGPSPEDALIHVDAATRHLEGLCQTEAALDLYRRALDCRDSVTGTRRIELLLQASATANRIGQREEERGLLDEALSIAEMGKDRYWRARAKRALGWHLLQTGRYEEARPLLEGVRELVAALDDLGFLAEVTGNLGAMHLLRSELEEARECFEEAIRLARLGEDRGERGPNRGEDRRSLANLGIAYLYLGRLDEAEASMKEAVELARAHGDRVLESNCLGNLGLVYGDQGRWTLAREHHAMQLSRSRETGHREGQLNSAFNLANVDWHLGHRDQAKSSLLYCIDLACDLGAQDTEGFYRCCLGKFDWDDGLLADALRRLETGVAMLHEAGNQRDGATYEAILGSLSGSLGRAEEARRRCRRAVEIARETRAAPILGQTLHLLAAVEAEAGEFEAAEMHAREALSHHRDAGVPQGIASASVLLGGLAREQNMPQKAKRHLEQACSLAAEHDLPATGALAVAELVLLGAETVNAAERAITDREDRLAVGEVLCFHSLLWRAGGGEKHLRAAHRLVQHLRDHAPEEDRDAVLANVSLHKEIEEAWVAAQHE